MSDLDLSALRRVAMAATPGPWTAHLIEDDLCNVGPSLGGFVAGDLTPADADYIAALDPQTVLSLLDRLERAERIEAAARKLIHWMDAPMAVPTAHYAVARVRQSEHGDEKKAAWTALREALEQPGGQHADQA